MSSRDGRFLLDQLEKIYYLKFKKFTANVGYVKLEGFLYHSNKVEANLTKVRLIDIVHS
jgi:hypothetical protein